MNTWEMFYDPCKSVLQMVQVLKNANAVANLTNVMRMKRENDTWVTNLHKFCIACVSLCLISASLCPMSLFSIKFVHIVNIRPASDGNVNTNPSDSFQMSYDHYKCLANNTNGLRLQICCEWLQICCE